MKNIAVLFGGQSSEHEISILSAINVIRQIDPDRYEIFLVGITGEGRWLLADSLAQVEDGSWEQSPVRAFLLPDASKKSLLLEREGHYREVKLDVVFPVLHGLFGEDGSVQGLLELAQIPYVGCGVLASALGMDKIYTKQIVAGLGIPQAEYVAILAHEAGDLEKKIGEIESRFSYPLFVKPSNAGSSKGVSKAGNKEELKRAIIEALNHDRKVLAEEAIQGHEVECAVLGKPGAVHASGVGEIQAAAAFYDFDAKYKNPQSRVVLHPDLPGDAAREIPLLAARIFSALDGFGLARVDFFVTEEGKAVFNEINTMPGFTAISMYPMLWEEQGITKAQLIDRLISLAYERGKN